jgi:hypothetical protein
MLLNILHIVGILYNKKIKFANIYGDSPLGLLEQRDFYEPKGSSPI